MPNQRKKNVPEFRTMVCDVCGNGFGTLCRVGNSYRHMDCNIAEAQKTRAEAETKKP